LRFGRVGKRLSFLPIAHQQSRARNSLPERNLGVAMTNEISLGEEDCILPPGQSTWITVGNLSVNVKHGRKGVSISVYALGKEMEESIAESWVTFRVG
jgi:hypothetical protein